MSGTEGSEQSEKQGIDSATIWGVTQAAAVLLILTFFLISLQGVLSPLLLFGLLIAALLPFRHLRGHSLLLALTAVLTSVWVIATAGSVLAPFILAAVLAYILDPVVDRLEKRGLNRVPAIVLLVGPVIALAVLAVVLGIPALGRQFGDFIEAVPALVERIQQWAVRWGPRLEAIPVIGSSLADRMASLDAEALVGILQDRQADLAARAWSAVLGLGRGLGSVFTVLGYVVLTPVLAFYLLRDWDGIVARIADLIPHGRRDKVVEFASEYDHLLGRYLRGQITVALIMGALTGIGLFVSGFPYAFLIGALVALFSVVPYLGLVLSLVPAVVVALTTGAIGASLLKVLIVFAVVQGLEGTVVSPRIVGDSVGLHPVWVVLALTAGGFYLGFAGLLLGVPIAVGIKLVVQRGVARYRDSEIYQKG